MATVGAIIHKDVVVTEEQIALIAVRYCTTSKPQIPFSDLNIVYLRNITKSFVDEFGEPDLTNRQVFPDHMWLQVRDLLSVCRGMFGPIYWR